MSIRAARWFAALSIAAALVSTARAAPEVGAATLPVIAFFRNPDIAAAKLSPSGRLLAVTASSESSRRFLGVIDLTQSTLELRPIANFSNADIRSFEWVNDERLVFNTIDELEALNDQRFGPGLYSIKADGSDQRRLIRFSWMAPDQTATRIVSQTLAPNHVLLRTLDDGSNDVIVGELRQNLTGDLIAINPKRLDVTTGRTVSLAAGAPEHAFIWLFDRKGEPRVVVTRDRGEEEIFWKGAGEDRWSSIARFSYIRARMVPLGVDGDGQLYVSTGSRAGSVFKRFDRAAGKPDAEALVSAPGFDLAARPVFDHDTGKLVGVRYETDARASVWFDEGYKQLQRLVDARFGGVNEIECRRCQSDGVVLVHTYGDTNPGSYAIYRPATQAWSAIGAARPSIASAAMGQLDLHRIKARDGEDLPVWITTPAGSAAKDPPRPAIVLVHGGPYLRGVHWQWGAEAQFLASRGYLVIEPEFRGSAGYGFHHFQAGFKQWGRAMDDDLTDAVRWAAAQGLADPARVCIMGASYGGYATLMALARNPQTYRCGVSWLAVTDMRLMYERSWLNDASAEWQTYGMPTMIGDPVKDAAMLEESSPVAHAKDIKAPLLMAFGGNDRRVPLEHGSAMRNALRRAGHDPEFIVYDGEGHGFLKVENRVDFYSRVEKFLAKNLQ